MNPAELQLLNEPNILERSFQNKFFACPYVFSY